MLVAVSPSVNIFEPLTYRYHGNPSDIKPGSRVIIPLGNRVVTGWVVASGVQSQFQGRIKNVIGRISDDYVPESRFMDFCLSIANLYFVSTAVLLDYSLSPKRKNLKNIFFDQAGESLSLGQLGLKELASFSKKDPICFYYKNRGCAEPDKDSTIEAQKRFTQPTDSTKGIERRFLLSYKRDEFYLDIISGYLQKGQAVLITVPDNASADWIKQVIPEADIFNSTVKTAIRESIWTDYQHGKVGVVVGGLSAVLMPIFSLGAVISERAGSPRYQSNAWSEFNVQTIAGLRSLTFEIPLIEGNSTPSIRAAAEKEACVIEDFRQPQDVELKVHMIKAGERRIPGSLAEIIEAYLNDNKKILLLLNRKTSSRYMFCPKCQMIHNCPHCRGALKIIEDLHVRCVNCPYEQKDLKHCSKCKGELVVIQDISAASIKTLVEQWTEEQAIFTLSAENFKESLSLREEIREKKVVISTPVILNSYFREMFEAVVYVRPESLFDIGKFDAAEMIFVNICEIRELVKPGGVIDIFSTFHFHYALRLINDEAAFLDRELKYRRMFRLPPYFNVYHLEVRHQELRKLAAHMRKIYRQFKSEFHIQRPYLISRQKTRGYYRGKMELHTRPEAILQSGLLKNRNIKIFLFAV